MRRSIILVAAFAAFASPVLAQDRTLPAGDYMLAQPPIDSVEPRAIAPVVPTFEGRSVGDDAVPVTRTRAHRRQ